MGRNTTSKKLPKSHKTPKKKQNYVLYAKNHLVEKGKQN